MIGRPHRTMFGSLLAAAVACVVAFGSSAAAEHPYVAGEVLIKFHGGIQGLARTEVNQSLGAVTLRRFASSGAEHWRLGPGQTVEGAIAEFKHHPMVAYIEPNYLIQAQAAPDDSLYGQQWGLENTGQTSGGIAGSDIDAEGAWNTFTGDPNMLIAVLDSGIDDTHPDLVDNLWINPGEIPGNAIDDDSNGFVDDVNGYDFINDDGDPFDDYGHGTLVAGGIAARGNNGIGVTGVVWQAKLMTLKILDAGGGGTTAAAIAAIDYAALMGAKITNNSWGGGGFSQALLDAIDAAGAGDQLFVAAAGNASRSIETITHFPASYASPYILSVTATNARDSLASFANWGFVSVDVGAPGDAIVSTLPGGLYGQLSGSSMSAPYATGVVALVRGRFPGLDALSAKNLVMSSVDQIFGLIGNSVTGGRINAFLAVSDPDVMPPSQIADLATTTAGSSTMGLSWTAPGDDGPVGTATRYEVYYATFALNPGNLHLADVVDGPTPQPSGSPETFEVDGLAFSTTYHFVVRAFDEYGNASPMSPNVSAATLGPPDISASPDSLVVQLLTGGTGSDTLMLSNDGAGSLDFSITIPQSISALLGAPLPEAWTQSSGFVLPKGAADPRRGRAALLGAGGPDAFGYRWTDSNEPGGPVYDWVDITGLTAPLALSGDDAASAPIDLGMSFPFYGDTFTTVRINTNGFLSLSDGGSPYTNTALPSTSGVPHMIAPMWDDMVLSSPGAVYAYHDGERFIVTWWGARLFGDIGFFIFQTLLYPSGEIRFQYQTLGIHTVTSTVGIQDGSESIGLTQAFNTVYLGDALAVRIVPPPRWLSVAPASGRIDAGQSMAIAVDYDAAGLPGGDFYTTIDVSSNDPDENPYSVPAHLQVVAAPDLRATPLAFDLDTVFVETGASRQLVIVNDGADDLNVISIVSDDPDVIVSDPSFVLAPTASRVVNLDFQPGAPKTLAATVTITSDDPDTPSLPIAVDAVAVAGPSASLSPDSLSVTLVRSSSTQHTVQIDNLGGASFTFTAQPMTHPLLPIVVHGSEDRGLAKGEADPVAGPLALGSGGPDLFGYTYSDSDEPGGPSFQWIEISGIGTPVPMVGDDVSHGPLPIGFDFPFYGDTMSSFSVCTNGFVSFTSSLATFTNAPLPNNGTGAPENLLAVFWDDLTFGPTQSAYYHSDSTRLVIQYQDVARLGDPGNFNTFQIVLHPDGTILYQYLTMNAQVVNNNTIGIQNAARDDGLLVAFNAPYVHDDLALQFRPPVQWLTVDPASGLVPAGGFLELTIGFDSHGLDDGPHEGLIRVSGNDPLQSQHDVVAALLVEHVPDVAANPTMFDFGEVDTGDSASAMLYLDNFGSEVLQVTGLITSHPDFVVTLSSLSIPPFSTDSVEIRFQPSVDQVFIDSLVVSSNDPDEPFIVLGLLGTSQSNPIMTLSATALTAVLAPALGPMATLEAKTVIIGNPGGEVLTWSAAPDVPWASVSADSGSVPVGDADTVTVTFDATGLADGDHPGLLQWTTNDPAALAHDLPLLLHAGAVTGALELDLGRNFIQAQNGWLEARIAPYGNCDTIPVELASLRIDGVHGVAPGAPAGQSGCGGLYTFNRFEVLSGITPGDPATVTGFGLVPGVTWFSASKDFTFLAPTINGINSEFDGGEKKDIRWDEPSGTNPSHYEVWFSPDSGASWQFLASGFQTESKYRMYMPTQGAANGYVEVVAFDGLDIIGVDYEGPFVVTPNVTAAGDLAPPERFGLRFAGANPARHDVRLELALAHRSDVDVRVFDVRGALVHRLARGPFEPGYHTLTWDGRNGAGRSVAPGLYFVRAMSGPETATLRFTLIR